MMPTKSSSEIVIVGGGIIGLSLAYEFAKRGKQVVLLERDRFGRKASWAGAGILTPANLATAIHPQEQLEATSNDLHEQWANELLRLTGIDNGFRKCGGLYVARTAGEVAALSGMAVQWQERNIECHCVDADQLRSRFSSYLCPQALDSPSGHSPYGHQSIRKAIWVPGESQISNPHQLDALVAACMKLGVVMKQEIGEATIGLSNGQLDGVAASGTTYTGQSYFLAAGPWTQQLVEPIGIQLPMQPVRGQIVLYKLTNDQSNARWPIVNEGSRYLVPRDDGHVLAGATIEEVGFDCRTTEEEIAGLRNWAESIHGSLNSSTYVKAWAGLRPGTYDGFAYLGQLGELKNAYVATGHFKSGLHLSTGTAVVMADLAEGKIPEIDLQPFSPARAADHHPTMIQ